MASIGDNVVVTPQVTRSPTVTTPTASAESLDFFHDHQLPFLSFPREIRDLIYDWALVVRLKEELYSAVLEDKAYERAKTAKDREFARELEDLHTVGEDMKMTQIRNHINICFTSKQVHDEASTILYSRNVFLYEFCGPSRMAAMLPHKHLPLVRHVKIRVHNTRDLDDPVRRHDAAHIMQLIRHLLKKMLTSKADLKTLEVQYLGPFDGVIEDVRGIVDVTADQSLWPTKIFSYMDDTHGRRVFVDKEYVEESNLWELQGCLNPLKSLTGRVHELSLKGDMSQAYKDILVKKIKPVIVREQLESEEHKRQGTYFGYHNAVKFDTIEDVIGFYDCLSISGVFGQKLSPAQGSAMERFKERASVLGMFYALSQITPSADDLDFCSIQTPLIRFPVDGIDPYTGQST